MCTMRAGGTCGASSVGVYVCERTRVRVCVLACVKPARPLAAAAAPPLSGLHMSIDMSIDMSFLCARYKSLI